MSKYKLRWMRNFEVHNMDFDNLALAIKMLITLDDCAKLTVTKPTGSIQAYRMSNGKVEWTTYDDAENEDVSEDVVEFSGKPYIAQSNPPTISLDGPNTAFVERSDAVVSILEKIRNRQNSQNEVDHFDELREKINSLTGINPSLIGGTNVTATQAAAIKIPEGNMYSPGSLWLDTMRKNLLTVTPKITTPILA